MLKIKLSRIGKKKTPMYRLIITEAGRDPYGRALEILGSYNPFSKDLQVKADRVKHWLSLGAQMTPTINNLLIAKGVIEGEKTKTAKITKRRQTKIEAEQKTAEKAKADKAAAKEAEAKAASEAKEAEMATVAEPKTAEAEAPAENEAVTDTTPVEETTTPEVPAVETPAVEAETPAEVTE